MTICLSLRYGVTVGPLTECLLAGTVCGILELCLLVIWSVRTLVSSFHVAMQLMVMDWIIQVSDW